MIRGDCNNNNSSGGNSLIGLRVLTVVAVGCYGLFQLHGYGAAPPPSSQFRSGQIRHKQELNNNNNNTNTNNNTNNNTTTNASSTLFSSSVSLDDWLRDDNNNPQPPPLPSCAPWLTSPNQRLIVLRAVRLMGWDVYQRGEGNLGGEAYYAAGLTYILERLLNFTVQISTELPFDNVTLGRQAHRILVDNRMRDGFFGWRYLESHPEILCKVRHVEYWCRRPPEVERLYGDPHKVLTPFPCGNLLPVSLFVHSQATLPPLGRVDVARKKRDRSVFILNKNCDYPIQIVPQLMAHGFLVYLTCFDEERRKQVIQQNQHLNTCHHHHNNTTTATDESSNNNNNNNNNTDAACRGKLVILEQPMLPRDYSLFLRHNVSILLGMFRPRDSPTPLEAVYNGVAFVQAAEHLYYDYAPTFYQVSSLRDARPPYVYNYDYSKHNDTANAANAIQAVLRAMDDVEYRTVGYIPSVHHVQQLAYDVCKSLVENDTPCREPKPNMTHTDWYYPLDNWPITYVDEKGVRQWQWNGTRPRGDWNESELPPPKNS